MTYQTLESACHDVATTDDLATRECLVAREYLRVSRDSSGRERSPEEQHDENQAAADLRLWRLGEPYRDVGSASDYQRKSRDAFDRMMADLEANTFCAQILILWVNDRGSRKVEEWIKFLGLLKERHVKVYITESDRLYDPNNDDDYYKLLDEGIDAEKYAKKLSKNVKRAANAAAKHGEPWGRCPYGHQRIYDTNRKFIRQEPNPKEAPVVAELIDRLHAGEPMNTIQADYKRRGIVKRNDKPFSPQDLRLIAANYAHAGLRVHDPSRWSNSDRKQRTWLSADARVVSAKWPAIVDVKKFHEVQRIFLKRRRVYANQFVARPGRAIHLLSRQPGVICAVCNSSLCTKRQKTTKQIQYRCEARGHFSVHMADLDNLLIDVVLEYLAREDNFQPAEQDESELQAVRKELAVQRQENEGLVMLSVALAAKKEPAILAEIARLEQRERDLMMPDELDGPLRPGADIAERWEVASVAARRTMVRVLMTSRYLGQLRITRVPADKRAVPVEQRVAFASPVPTGHPCLACPVPATHASRAAEPVQ